MEQILFIILTITAFLTPDSAFQGEEPPPPQIVVGEEQFFAGIRGRLCLNDGSGCADTLVYEAEAVSLPPGLPITLHYGEPYPDLVVLRLYQQAEVPIFSTAIIPQGQRVEWQIEEAGAYRLRVLSFWDETGFAEDYFRIVIPDITMQRPPQAFLLIGEQRIEGELTGFCWAGSCGDGYPSVARFVSLGGSKTLQIQFDQPHPDTVSMELYADLFDLITGRADAVATSELTLSQDMLEWAVDVPDGYYVLTVFARWEPQGSATYFFGVVIY
jgi:hypothetical protein